MSADQLVLELDHEDVTRLGFIERRPVPGRQVGHPVGHDDRGQPIYRPVWVDFTWFAVSVLAADVADARYRRHSSLRHGWLIGLWTTDEWNRMTTEQQTDARDQRSTAYDIARMRRRSR